MDNKKTKRNQEIFKFVYASALIAIIVILTATVGYIPFFGGIKITILHIPVILGAMVLGKRYGLLLGFVFGAGAMIRSFIEVVPENVPFTNPLLSVLPRMLFGYVAALLYDAFRKIFKREAVSVTLAAITATMFHTLIVVPILFVVAKTGFHFFASEHTFIIEKGFLAYMLFIIVNNMLLEIAAAAVIGAPIVLAIKKAMTQQPAEA